MNLVPKFVDALKTCVKSKDISSAKDMYTLLCKHGLETNEDIGNHLVPMFVECGSLHDAQDAFDRIIHRNVHCWTYLIAGYVQHGKSSHALNLYCKMHADHIQPSCHTFAALLKGCSFLENLQNGEVIYLDIVKKGFEQDLFVAGALIHMYVKRGLFPEAQVVLEKLLIRDVVLWNVLIMGYVEHGEDHSALDCFKCMHLHGTLPNPFTLSCILKASGSLGDIDKGRELYEEVVKKGLERDPFVSSSLIEMLVKCGNISDARCVLEHLPWQNTVLWNQLIAGYGERMLYKEVLMCIEQMQVDNIRQDTVTLVWHVKSCTNMQAIPMGMESHREIMKQGVETDIYLGSTIVDMYVKFGWISEAREVFLQLPSPNIVAWNVLITGYAEYGPFEAAFTCLQEMEDALVPPTSITFMGIVKACVNLWATDKGFFVHIQIICKGLEADHSLCNTLISMYSHFGMLLESRKVFDSMPKQCVVSWNTLISGYIDHRCGSDEAIHWLEQMTREGISPDAVTFSLILKTCESTETVSKGHKMHAEMIKRGFDEDQFIGSTLVDMYMKCSRSTESQAVFDTMPCHTVVSWNSLIAGYTDNGFGMNALEGLQRMQLQGVSPTSITYTSVMNACSDMNDVHNGREMHSEIVKKQFESDPLVNNALVGMYKHCGMLDEALYCACVDKDGQSWCTLVAAHADFGNFEEILSISERMRHNGLLPDVLTHVNVLKAATAMKFLDKGQQTHQSVVHQGFDQDPTVCSALIEFYMKCGSLEEAKTVSESLPSWNIVHCNCAIAGYIDHGLEQEAFTCFKAMQEQRISPNTVTYLLVLRACGSKMGAAEKAWQIHEGIMLQGFESDCHVGSTLVDMYVKRGLFAEANHVFENLPMRNEVAWNAMIKGYGLHHNGPKALQLFKGMCAQGVKPDATTFTCMLTACSRTSMIVVGREMFRIMSEEYGIAPTEDHVFCLVDLLARSGELREAGKYLDCMPCSPSEHMWATVLSACSTYHQEKKAGI